MRVIFRFADDSVTISFLLVGHARVLDHFTKWLDDSDDVSKTKEMLIGLRLIYAVMSPTLSSGILMS